MGLSDVQPDNQKHRWQPRLALGTEVEGCLWIEPSAYWSLMVSEIELNCKTSVGVRELVMACGKSEPTLCLALALFVRAKVSCVWFFVTLWALAHQAPLSMGFSRQEYWSGLPFPPQGDLPTPGIEPMSLMSLALAGRFFTPRTTWGAQVLVLFVPCIIEPRQTHLFGIVSSSVSQLCLLSTYWMQRNMPLKWPHHFLQSGKSLFKDKRKPIYCRRRYPPKAEDWGDWSQGWLMEGCSQWVVQKRKLRLISSQPRASIVVSICHCWHLSR